jgi:hypothetical protein
MAGFSSCRDPSSVCVARGSSFYAMWALQSGSHLHEFSIQVIKLSVSKRLYDHSRWATLTQSFRLAIYTLNTLPTEPLLHLALYAGLASLKLPSCYDLDHAGTKNVDCPVCDAGLGKLAEEVPFSHHVNSTIVCRLSGKIMDGDNMPMAFRNGNVYSREVSSIVVLLHTIRQY